MGQWKYFIVAQSAHPLNELGALADARGRLRLNSQFSGGWQVWEHPGEPAIDADDLALALTRETGSPALVGFVMDSDYVVLEAASPTAEAWTACLGAELMASYLAEDGNRLGDWFLPPEEAASRGAEWAFEAGRNVDVPSLVEIFQADAHPFAEDQFFEFLNHIGLH